MTISEYFRDLKRDVAKKLEKLERRTQRAIVELIRKYSENWSIILWMNIIGPLAE